MKRPAPRRRYKSAMTVFSMKPLNVVLAGWCIGAAAVLLWGHGGLI
jgi:hypothetical protein